MRWIALALALLAFPPASAQVNQTNIPANSVVGRLGIGAGPTQAIPFATLTANLFVSPIAGSLTLNPAANSGAQGLFINQSLAGSTFPSFAGGAGTGSTALNGVYISQDTGVAGNAFLYDFDVTHVFGGSSASGGRQSYLGWLVQTAATSVSNPERFYTGGGFISDTRSGDGGTNTSSGALGGYVGLNGQVRLGASAVNVNAATVAEFDNYNATGASAKYNWGINIVSNNSVQGASSDAGLIFYAGGASGSFGPGVGWHQGISFAEVSSNGLPPVDSAATVIGTHLESLSSFSAATGVDFTKFNFSGNAWQSSKYSVSGGGFVNIGPNTIGDSVPLSIVNQANAASVTAVTGSGNNLHIAGADATANTLIFDSFGGGVAYLNRRSDGTAASRTGLVANDNIINLQAAGWTSSGAYSGAAAAIQALATETWSSSANGAQIKLRTTKNTTTTLADAVVVDGVGHVQLGSIAPTSVSTCGTGSITANSTDSAGQVTATGATSCTLNFGNSYASAPTCVVSDNTTAAALKVATTTGGFTVTGLTSSDVFSYICIGKVGL